MIAVYAIVWNFFLLFLHFYVWVLHLFVFFSNKNICFQDHYDLGGTLTVL